MARTILELSFLFLSIIPLVLSFDRNEFRVDRETLGNVVKAFNSFDGEMYAGLMPTKEVDAQQWNESKFMFWLFQPENMVAPDTFTLWFNGGPGCSSFQGGMFEIAPISIEHHPAGYPKTSLNPPLLENAFAWTKATNIMMVEMPQGVGFSSGPFPDSEFDISADMHGFLQNFFDTFPEMRKKKLFLFGESYAGYYVSSIAHAIFRNNKNLDGDRQINLEGIGLGNGWVDAETQGPVVIDYAWWHGLIDTNTKESLHSVWDDCIKRKHMPYPFHDFTIPDECNVMNAVLEAAGSDAFPPDSFRSPNPYDVTTFDLYPVLFGQGTLYNFYNTPEIKKALNAPPDIEWEGCIPGAGRRRLETVKESLPGEVLLAQDRPVTVVPYIAELLDNDIRVIIYNGDRDLTTSAQGSEMVLNKMEWSGSSEWLTSSRGLWMVNESVAGFCKVLNGLQFVVVYNAGHLLPNSNPEQALDLITRFVTDTPLLDTPLPRFDKYKLLDATQRQNTKNKKNPEISIILFKILAAFCCFSIGYSVGANQYGRRHDYSEIS